RARLHSHALRPNAKRPPLAMLSRLSRARRGARGAASAVARSRSLVSAGCRLAHGGARVAGEAALEGAGDRGAEAGERRRRAGERDDVEADLAAVGMAAHLEALLTALGVTGDGTEGEAGAIRIPLDGLDHPARIYRPEAEVADHRRED